MTILKRLGRMYPDAGCSLDFRNPFELLVATILSAQSTDATINQVTPKLFKKYPTPQELARAKRPALEQVIHSTGFFRNKAKAIQGTALAIVKEHGGEVPSTMDELTSLPGVGRKTANVVLGNAFGRPAGVVVDTHVKRVSNRLGLTDQSDPEKIERDLMEQYSKRSWVALSHRLIRHGREICHARKPACEACDLSDICPSSRV